MRSRMLIVAVCLVAALPAVARAAGGPQVRDLAEIFINQFRETIDNWLREGGAASATGGTVDADQALSDLDRQLDQALGDPDTAPPPLPGSCLEREGCAECMERPTEQLARSRVLLARARALWEATHKYAVSAQALGDNLAPSTREAAFIWQAQKPKIAASLAQLDAAYDRKIAAMLAPFKAALQEIDGCERRFYNNPDWFARFGFIYYEFMESRYKRQ